MRRFAVTTALCALLLGGWTTTAQAGKWDVGGGLMLGMGGDVSTDVGGVSVDADLGVTAGFGLFFDYEIWKYVDIGVEAAFLWWEFDVPGADRDLWIDISPYVKGKYRFLQDKLEVYAKVPLGLTISVADETDGGLNTGLRFGVSYNVWSGLWPYLELGWALHWVDAARSATANQFALNLGVAWSY